MKEELINKFLEKALQYLQTAEAFTAKEVPEYIRELLSFKMMEHIVDGLSTSLFHTAFFGTMFSFLLVGLAYDIIFDEKYNHKILLVPIFVYTLIFSTSIVANQDDFMQAYKAYSAPRVYLIDYFRKEVK